LPDRCMMPAKLPHASQVSKFISYYCLAFLLSSYSVFVINSYL
jgi:hypothetical protein